MKKLLLSVIACSILSCSKDDDLKEDPATYQKAPVVSQFTIIDPFNASTAVHTVTYDDLRRITKIEVTGSGDRTILFAYNSDNQVIQVTEDTSGGLHNDWTLHYDAQKRYSGHSNSGVEYPATYNAANGVYTCKMLSAMNVKAKLADNGDILQFYNTYYDLDYSYEVTKKGALQNVVGNSPFVLGLYSYYFQYVLSKNARTGILTSGTVDIGTDVFANYENEFNAQEMLSQTTMHTHTNNAIVSIFEYIIL